MYCIHTRSEHHCCEQNQPFFPFFQAWKSEELTYYVNRTKSSVENLECELIESSDGATTLLVLIFLSMQCRLLSWSIRRRPDKYVCLDRCTIGEGKPVMVIHFHLFEFEQRRPFAFICANLILTNESLDAARLSSIHPIDVSANHTAWLAVP